MDRPTARPTPAHRRAAWAWLTGALLGMLLLSCAARAPHATDLAVYDDDLADGWADWSWQSTRDFAATATVHAGARAVAVTADAGWSGFSLRAPAPLPAGDYTALAFWVYGGVGGNPISVYFQATDDGPALARATLTAPAGQWTEVILPLSSLGSPTQIARITWLNDTPASQPTYYLDDIRLLASDTPGPTPGADVQLQVDVAAQRAPISPAIYGVNTYGLTGDPVAYLQSLGITVRRWGGNATSRYNYRTDVSNHASDWYFANLKQSDATDLPHDSAVNRVLDQNRAAGADSFVVMPTSGYVSNADGQACGFGVDRYGAQTATAAGDGRPNCGSGIALDGAPITDNDPFDTSIAAPPSFVGDWVRFLVDKYGRAAEGGIRFYNLDNEPDIWFESHRDIRPVGITYAQLRAMSIDYGAAIKAADPTALVLGPVVHGWSYYFHSPYDGQRGDWASPDDRDRHGGVYLVPWYLQQMAAYEQTHGVRLLDYLDLHFYPQAPGVALSRAGDAATQARRLRSTRALWDATYVDESWISSAGPDGGIVRLLPRMRAWVDEFYPGTQLAIGEYNWGGLEHINGALAQAEVLGIFGREGVGLATLWEPPGLTQPGAFAFRLYRNYDGQGGHFGDTRVAATSSAADRLSLFAAQRSADGALTLVVINKHTAPLTARLSLAHFTPGGAAAVYRYSEADLTAIVRLPDVTLDGAPVLSFPAASMTLFVLPGAVTAPAAHLPIIVR